MNSTSTLTAIPAVDLAEPHRPALSVVICADAVDRWDDLRAAVEAARGQLRDADELILVIDHNPELQARAQAALAGVRITPNTGVQGAAGARHTGVALAAGDIVVFLTDDVLALPGMIDEIGAAMTDPSVVAVGGAARPVWPGGRRPWWFAEELDWVVGCGHPARTVDGASTAFRRDVLAEIGPVTTGIGEQIRRKRPAAVIRHLPGARAALRVDPARATWRYVLRRCYQEGVTGRGLLRHFGRLLRGRPAEAGRIAAILLGVVCGVLGYARNRLAFRSGPAATGFEPVFIGTADVRDEIDLPLRSPAGLRYESAEILVRNGLDLVGLIHVPEHRMGQRAAVCDLTGPVTPPPRSAAPDVVGISVVIPTFDRPDQAAACVRSVLATGWPALEVLIVDNNPGNAECAAALRWLAAENDRVRYVPAPERGASAARNRGIAAATHDIVAFTDDDVLVDRHWPAAIALAFEDLTVACVTGLVRPRRLETRAQLLFERRGGFGRGTAARRYCGDVPAENEAGPLYPYAAGMFGSGHNMAFRRAVLGEIGGYDVRLGPGVPARAGADLDLFVRVLQAGYVLLYDPRALVYHDHRDGADELRRQLYGHGCGLTAMLARQLVAGNGSPAGLLRRTPPGLWRLLAGRHRPAGYPLRLVLAEWRGLAAGPLRYLLSRLLN